MPVTDGRAALLATVTEKEWQAQVFRWAQRGGWHVHWVYDSRRSSEGWPDLFLVRNGRAIAAELKTMTGQLRRAQGGWLVWLRECGIETYVWRPDQECEVKEILGA